MSSYFEISSDLTSDLTSEGHSAQERSKFNVSVNSQAYAFVYEWHVCQHLCKFVLMSTYWQKSTPPPPLFEGWYDHSRLSWKTDSAVDSAHAWWKMALTTQLTSPIICQSPTRPTRSRWCQFPLCIELSGWFSVIERCIGVQREDTEPLERLEEEERGDGCFRNQEMLYKTRAMRLAVNNSHPRNQLILIDWTDWAPHQMKMLNHTKTSYISRCCH